jgi:cation diffusion facilitator CzcD-associated flavoprotein CzcO
VESHEFIIICTVINGIHQLHRLREAGCDVLALEAGSGVGGTWFWNRYPGARLDSECYTYTYNFSRELVEGWDWPEHFADQPTLERYFNYVVDEIGLRAYIHFDARVTACEWCEADRCWELRCDDGRSYRARYVVAATGLLSAPHVPRDLDLSAFEGQVVRSTDWPREGLDLAGKRVGVFGVGSTGIQIVQSIAPAVESLVVFQRTANWATPLNNEPIDDEGRRDLRARADEIFDRTMSTRGCFLYSPQGRSTWDVSPEEREAVFEELYAGRGMSLYQGGFNDVLIDKAANDEVVAFLSRKIRERVEDPETARKLIPTHPYATRRPPLETGYFETYNRANVRLVHLPEEPLRRVTATGVETADGEYPLDVIVLATGFDAITGSFVRLGLRGVDGLTLSEHWSAGPRTYLGICVSGFPNLFVLAGPQGVNGNLPRCTGAAVEWICDCVCGALEDGIDRIEATPAAEAEWVARCNSYVEGTLLEKATSWAWGSNIPGKPRAFTLYIGPQPEFREMLGAVAEEGYAGISMSGPGHPPTASASIGGPLAPATPRVAPNEP